MMTALANYTERDIEVLAAEPHGPIGELARALKLVAPSLGDHAGIAQTCIMIMKKRGVVLARAEVVFQ